MSAWDGTKVIRFATKRDEYHEGWAIVDCGCCMGLQWGGETPRDCRYCMGSGFVAVHLATGTRALYPGGPFLGCRSSADELTAIRNESEAAKESSNERQVFVVHGGEQRVIG